MPQTPDGAALRRLTGRRRVGNLTSAGCLVSGRLGQPAKGFKPMKFRQIAATLTAALMASACGEIVDQRGHQPVPGTVEKLEVGTQGRDDVLRLMGSPST